MPTGGGEDQPCWIDPVLEERLRLTTKSSVGLPAAELREVVVAEGYDVDESIRALGLGAQDYLTLDPGDSPTQSQAFPELDELPRELAQTSGAVIEVFEASRGS